MSDISVTDNTAESRFEIHADGKLASFIVYSVADDVVTYVHTETFPEFAGQGIGGELASGALDLTRAAGQRVDPQCPFVKGYIAKHEEYADLVV